MTIAATTAAKTAQLGRTRITSRALSRVVAAVAAEELGVAAKQVNAALADHNGALALTVTSPIRVVSLDRVQSDPSLVQSSGGSIVDRSARAQEVIRDRVAALTGSMIGRVAVHISGVIIEEGARVI